MSVASRTIEWDLTFQSSAPGEPQPPSATSGIRRDVVSEVQTMVSDIRHILKSQGRADGQPQLVNITCNLPVAEYTLVTP